MHSRSRNGQALVETALVLPVLGLAIAAAATIVCMAHNMICLQFAAAKAARRMFSDAPTTMAISFKPSLWGRTSLPVLSRQEQRPTVWRPFQGLASTIHTPGRLVRMRVRSMLLPEKGYGRVLPTTVQEMAVETFLEPAMPSER